MNATRTITLLVWLLSCARAFSGTVLGTIDGTPYQCILHDKIGETLAFAITWNSIGSSVFIADCSISLFDLKGKKKIGPLESSLMTMGIIIQKGRNRTINTIEARMSIDLLIAP